MDMNGQWPVSPWDFASGPSRSYSQSARSPILHRSPLTSQCVLVNATCEKGHSALLPTMPRVQHAKDCPVSSAIHCPETLCTISSIDRVRIFEIVQYREEPPIMQCHCHWWHLGFGKLFIPLWELVLCTRWQGLLGSHSHEPMFPCFHLPPSY